MILDTQTSGFDWHSAIVVTNVVLERRVGSRYVLYCLAVVQFVADCMMLEWRITNCFKLFPDSTAKTVNSGAIHRQGHEGARRCRLCFTDATVSRTFLFPASSVADAWTFKASNCTSNPGAFDNAGFGFRPLSYFASDPRSRRVLLSHTYA